MITLSELAVAVVFVSATDSFTVSDTGALNDFGAVESVTLSEAHSSSATLTASDGIVLTDLGDPIGTPTEFKFGTDTVYLGHNFAEPTGTDSLTFTDAGSVAASSATTLVRDTVTLTEAASVTEIPIGGVNKTDTDTVTQTETNSSVDTSSDGVEVTLTDVGAVSVTLSAVDAFAVSEQTVLNIGQNTLPTSTDSVTLSDTGTVSVSASGVDSTTLTEVQAVVSEAGTQFVDTNDALTLSEGTVVTASELVASDGFTVSEGTVSQAADVVDPDELVASEQPVAITGAPTGVDTVTLLSEVGSRLDFTGRARGVASITARAQGTASVTVRFLGEVELD